EVLHELNIAVASTIEAPKMLGIFLEKVLIHLPYAAAMVRLRQGESGLLETVASKGIKAIEFETSLNPLGLVDESLTESMLVVSDVVTDQRIKDLAFFRREELGSFVGLPMVANGEFLGSLIFLARDEHHFGEEELEFLSTLTGQVAIALHHSQLFD